MFRDGRWRRGDGTYPRVVYILVFDRLEQFVESFGILAYCRSGVRCRSTLHRLVFANERRVRASPLPLFLDSGLLTPRMKETRRQ